MLPDFSNLGSCTSGFPPHKREFNWGEGMLPDPLQPAHDLFNALLDTVLDSNDCDEIDNICKTMRQINVEHSKNSPCDNWEWWQAACVRRNFKFDYNALVAVSKLELWKKTYKIFCSLNDEKRDLLRTLNKTVERTNTIPDNAFDGCSKFNVSRLPQSTLKIGKFAFRGCTGLTMTKLPPLLKFIGSRAFFQCTNMDLVAIPEELVAIDIRAFEQASQATQARWEKYSENYTYEYSNFLVVHNQVDDMSESEFEEEIDWAQQPTNQATEYPKHSGF